MANVPRENTIHQNQRAGWSKIIQMTDVIVGFWFLPVTVFIIIPLLMLCGWSLSN
jgi:hypothetical protein